VYLIKAPERKQNVCGGKPLKAVRSADEVSKQLQKHTGKQSSPPHNLCLLNKTP